MRVLFLAAEATPYVKVGGLGDVAGALPAALRAAGAEVKLFMPRYGTVDPGKWKLRKCMDNFAVPLGDWRSPECQLLVSEGGHDYFVENDYYFGSRFQVYGNDDDADRFVLFCRAAIEACRLSGWVPDIIHAHDWHSAAAIRLVWPRHERPGLVYTIHNLAHQGMVSPSKWPLLGVYDGRGILNLMQQAVLTADVVTTVSPTYAREIQTGEYGFGLDWMLRERAHRLVGIINGIDTDAWDPSNDKHIPAAYSSHDLSGKRQCKMEFQRQMGLTVNPDVPLLGVVSRLDDQKGIKLILDSLGTIFAFTEAQLVVLGSGHSEYENGFRSATWHHGDRFANWIGFNNGVAHQVYAASDMFLMPSSFEPCGISQMFAMRYGSLPVVRSTGGLVDTVPDRGHPDGVGYHFGPYDTGAFQGALGRALRDYYDRPSWEGAMRRAMQTDFSWHRSAGQYLDVYRWALQVRG